MSVISLYYAKVSITYTSRRNIDAENNASREKSDGNSQISVYFWGERCNFLLMTATQRHYMVPNPPNDKAKLYTFSITSDEVFVGYMSIYETDKWTAQRKVMEAAEQRYHGIIFAKRMLNKAFCQKLINCL